MSVRFRLVIGMVLLVSVVLAAVNVTGILLLRSYLLDRVDGQTTGAFAPPEGEPPDETPPDLCANPRDPRGLRSDFLLLVVSSDHEVVCSLGPELGDDAPDLDLEEIPGTEAPETVASIDGSTRWRVRAVDTTDDDQTVVLAVSLADADATVDRLTRLSLIVSAVVLVLTAAAAWVIAGIGLRPLTKIEETAERIADGDLSERVPSFRPRTEIGRLSRALNGMLGQLEHAFTARTESEAKLRRFVSDASHELRTPVAVIRGHAELWRTGISTDLGSIMGRIEAESTRMGELVDDLLLLARLDQSRPLERHPVDLLDLASDAVVDAQALQPDRQISLDVRPGAVPLAVIGDEARLRQIVANLMTNALAHTPPSSPIDVQLRSIRSRVEVSVRDAGPGMPPDVAAKVFDRFYRADEGRASGRSGLGLAIVKSLAEAHGGTVSCTSDIESGSTFLVSLPLAPPD